MVPLRGVGCVRMLSRSLLVVAQSYCPLTGCGLRRPADLHVESDPPGYCPLTGCGLRRLESCSEEPPPERYCPLTGCGLRRQRCRKGGENIGWELCRMVERIPPGNSIAWNMIKVKQTLDWDGEKCRCEPPVSAAFFRGCGGGSHEGQIMVDKSGGLWL